MEQVNGTSNGVSNGTGPVLGNGKHFSVNENALTLLGTFPDVNKALKTSKKRCQPDKLRDIILQSAESQKLDKVEVKMLDEKFIM